MAIVRREGVICFSPAKNSTNDEMILVGIFLLTVQWQFCILSSPGAWPRCRRTRSWTWTASSPSSCSLSRPTFSGEHLGDELEEIGGDDEGLRDVRGR